MARISESEFRQRIIAKHGKAKFEFISGYCGVSEPLKVKCLDCESVFETTQARSLLGRFGCMSCRDINNRGDSDSFITNVNLKHAHIKIIGNYVNSRTEVEYVCNKCGTVNSKLPSRILDSKEPCDTCFRPNGSCSHMEFVEKVRIIHGSNYEVLSEYVNNDLNIQVRCRVCDTTRIIKTAQLLKGDRCQECDRRSRTLSHQEFMNRLKDSYAGADYEVLSTFKSNNTKMRFKHLKCGSIFTTTPKLFLSGSRCPYCTTMSSGAKVVYDYLTENNIPTILECTHEYLVNPATNYKLRMDFLCKINNIYINIEYNGRQHYYDSKFSTTLSEVEYLDKVKLDFCKKFGVFQIVVPYVIPLESIHQFLKYYLANLETGKYEVVSRNLIDKLVYSDVPYGDWCLK